MLRLTGILCFAALLAGLFAAQNASADEKMFTSLKCTKCHAISALGIKAIKSAGDDDEDASNPPPDLSNAGNFHDAVFFTGFLKKEIVHVAHAGNTATKKHSFAFKGTDDELKTMATWLATMKKEPVK